jgi:hypothetical protein
VDVPAAASAVQASGVVRVTGASSLAESGPIRRSIKVSCAGTDWPPIADLALL